MMRIIRAVCVGILALVVAGMTGWAALAIRYSELPRSQLLAALFAGGTVLAFVALPRRKRTPTVLGPTPKCWRTRSAIEPSGATATTGSRPCSQHSRKGTIGAEP